MIGLTKKAEIEDGGFGGLERPAASGAPPPKRPPPPAGADAALPKKRPRRPKGAKPSGGGGQAQGGGQPSGGGGGGGGRNGGGKGLGKADGKTPDGRWKLKNGVQYCYAYCHFAKGCAEPCVNNRAHACEWCNQPHRSIDCPKKPAGWAGP